MNPTINEDNQLLQALQRGEETAFDRLFRKYYPLCCAYGSRFVNPEDAKELAGDAIAWLWEHRQDLRIETSLSSYLLKSVQNRALNLRQRGRTPLPRTVGLGEKGDR